jgi:hypothetical protein
MGHGAVASAPTQELQKTLGFIVAQVVAAAEAQLARPKSPVHGGAGA